MAKQYYKKESEQKQIVLFCRNAHTYYQNELYHHFREYANIHLQSKIFST